MFNTAGNRNDNTDNNTGVEIIATLRNQLNNEAYFSAEEFASYNVNTLVNYFAGNPTSTREVGSTSSLNAFSAVFTVNRTLKAAVMSYASIDDVPETINTRVTYTWDHQVGSERSGFSTYRWHYLRDITRAYSQPQNNVKSDLAAYRDAFSPENLEVDLSTLTDPEIVARYETMNAALAKGNRFGSEVLDYFGLLSLTEAAAYVANLKYLADIAQFRPDVNYFINAFEIDYEALTLQEQRDLRTASTTVFNRLNALRTNTAYATVRLFFEEYYDLDFDAIDNFRTALNHNIECIELQAYKDYFDDIIANLVIPFEAEGSLPNDEFYALVNEFTSKYNAVVGSDASNVPFYTGLR